MRIVSRLARCVRRTSSDERGVALFIAAGSMIALTSVCALAIDVGMLYTARGEAQRVADGAALAGAGALIASPNNSELATLNAVTIGGLNTIGGQNANVLASDVTVDLTNKQVTVNALRTEARGNPMGTFFARMFGVTSVDIGATATAEASNAGGITCLLPLALPDRWIEGPGTPNDPNDFELDAGDVYIPWAVPDSDPVRINADYTGYSESDIGSQFTMKSNTGGGGLNPSWYYPWRPPGQTGADDYRTNVAGCVDPSISYSVGQQVETEPGNMSGPTMQGFRDLIDLDPNAAWNDVMDCIVDDIHRSSLDASYCRSSPRVRPIPMFDPREEIDAGTKPFTFTNFAGVFVEEIQGQDVVARWIGYTGVDPTTYGSDGDAGPLFKVLRLVK
jgi:FlaG/FlaF family flagellin (archaellin)